MRSWLRFASSMRGGSLKTSSNFRNRTGPTVGNMFSAMQASVEFMIYDVVEALAAASACLLDSVLSTSTATLSLQAD